MNVYEIVALGEYFYAFPNDIEYDEVLDMFINKDDEVILWEVFDSMPRESVVELVDTLKEVLEKLFVPREVTP